MKSIPKMWFWFVLGGVGWLGAGSPMVWGVSFTYTTIADPGAGSTFLTGINDAGEVLGYGETNVEGAFPVFVYQAGIYTSIGSPEIPVLPQALNNNGTILARGLGENDLGINNFGTTYVVNANTFTRVSVPSQFLEAGINDLGQIVGTYSSSSNPNSSGFFFNGSTVQTLNVPGTTQTYANGINDLDQIVGYSINYSAADGTTPQGFVYAGGTYETISVPGAYETEPTGINNLGEIVGIYEVGGPNGTFYGFVDNGGVFSTLNLPAGFNLAPAGIVINDVGQIAGTWESSSGVTGFVATPVTPAAPTPETGTLVLVGTGMVVIAGAAGVRRSTELARDLREACTSCSLAFRRQTRAEGVTLAAGEGG